MWVPVLGEPEKMTSCFLLIVVIFFPIENLMHYHLISYLVTFFSSFLICIIFCVFGILFLS